MKFAKKVANQSTYGIASYDLKNKKVEVRINIPITSKIKAIMKNSYFFTFDKPIKAIPISSGKGETMIIAPIIGSVHLKYLLFNNFATRFMPNRLSSGFISSNRPSFIKRKIVKSPTAPPNPAMIAISSGESFSAKINKITAPMAAVNDETNNNPPMNAPKYPQFPKLRRNVRSISMRKMIKEKTTLAIKKVRFLYFHVFQ